MLHEYYIVLLVREYCISHSTSCIGRNDAWHEVGLNQLVIHFGVIQRV